MDRVYCGSLARLSWQALALCCSMVAATLFLSEDIEQIEVLQIG
jgi:hypothetical protein